MDYGIPAELITPKGTLVLNDYASPAHYRISGVPDEGAPIRGTTEARPGLDGSDILAPSLRGHRMFRLAGQITLDERVGDALGIRRRMMDDWSSALEAIRQVDGTFRWLPRGAWNHAGPLTVAGNEITDALRLLGVQGDGRTYPDGSLGLWGEMTNLNPNGGFEASLASWGASDTGTASMTVTRDLTVAKFGSASLRLDNTLGGEDDCEFTTIGGLVASTSYAISAWCYCPVFTAGAVSNRGLLSWDLANPGATIQEDKLTAVTSGWVRKTIVVTTTAAGGAHSIELRLYSPQGTVYWDGVQVEAHPFGGPVLATPYVHTAGSTVARGRGRIRVPTAGLNGSQGYAVLRVRPGWPRSNNPWTGIANAPFLAWTTAGANWLGVFHTPGSASITAIRADATGNTQVSQAAPAWAAGDTLTLILVWTPSTIKLSVNGAAFTSAANTKTAAVRDALLDLGTLDSGIPIYADFLFAALGTGLLTDADAARLAALFRDPYPSDFPTAAPPVVVVTGDDLYASVLGWRGATVRTWDAPPPRGDLVKEFQAQLLAANPEVVADTLQTADTGALGGSVTVTNGGKARAYPTLKLYGPFTAATITNTTTGQSIVLVYTVTAGHYLEIDPRLQTIRYDGSALSPVDSAANPATTAWWALEPGANVITWTGAGGSGAEHARLEWRDTWMP